MRPAGHALPKPETLHQLRLALGLGDVWAVTPYAKRPPCGWCGEPMFQRSYVHNATEGCIHTRCRRERSKFIAVWKDIDTARAIDV